MGSWSQVVSSPSKENTLNHVPILRQVNQVGTDGSYTYGYESADGTFKAEYKDVIGNVQGKYGYIDEYKNLRIVSYSVNKNEGFKILGDQPASTSSSTGFSGHIESLKPKPAQTLPLNPSLSNNVDPNPIHSNLVSSDSLFDTPGIKPISPIRSKNQDIPRILLPPGFTDAVKQSQTTEMFSEKPFISTTESFSTLIPVTRRTTTEVPISPSTTTVPTFSTSPKIQRRLSNLPAGTFSLSNTDDVRSFFKDNLQFRNFQSDPILSKTNQQQFVPHPNAPLQNVPQETPSFSTFVNQQPSHNINTGFQQSTNQRLDVPFADINDQSTFPGGLNQPSHSIKPFSTQHLTNQHRFNEQIPKNNNQPTFFKANPSENEVIPETSIPAHNQLKLILVPRENLHQNSVQDQSGSPLVGFLVPNNKPHETTFQQFLQKHSRNSDSNAIFNPNQQNPQFRNPVSFVFTKRFRPNGVNDLKQTSTNQFFVHPQSNINQTPLPQSQIPQIVPQQVQLQHEHQSQNFVNPSFPSQQPSLTNQFDQHRFIPPQQNLKQAGTLVFLPREDQKV